MLKTGGENVFYANQQLENIQEDIAPMKQKQADRNKDSRK